MNKSAKWTKTFKIIGYSLFGTVIFFQVSTAAEKKQSTATSTNKKIEVNNTKPDGDLVNGVRVIPFDIAFSKQEINVNRGEEVKIVFVGIKDSNKISIPDLSLEATNMSATGVPCILEFKADKTGTFPVNMHGVSQIATGSQITSLHVREFEHNSDAIVFKSINPADAFKKIRDGAFVLDVRTPKEYEQEHLKDAVLIPVQQLSERIGEISRYKDSSVVVYCRAGNRSITASEILINNGFKKVFNMNKGIMGWKSENLPIVK